MSYKMMTATEAIDYLFTLPSKERVFSFTFDDLDLDPDCDPSGWHGVQMTRIFDEWHGVFAVGYWGGGSTFAYDIYGNVDGDTSRECVSAFCAQKLQVYMNNFGDCVGPCEKICVEVKEF